MNTYIKGIYPKKTVFNWWIGDGYSRSSCLTGKSGVILLVAFPEDTGSPLILPSTSTPCPNPPGIQITWGQHERNITNVEIPLWAKSFGQFYKRLSMNMVCTCLPLFLPKKRDYLFSIGETEQTSSSDPHYKLLYDLISTKFLARLQGITARMMMQN